MVKEKKRVENTGTGALALGRKDTWAPRPHGGGKSHGGHGNCKASSREIRRSPTSAPRQTTEDYLPKVEKQETKGGTKKVREVLKCGRIL